MRTEVFFLFLEVFLFFGVAIPLMVFKFWSLAAVAFGGGFASFLICFKLERE